MTESKSCIIIGCGLVGSLAAHFMLKLGYVVTIYEKREDPRMSKTVEGRSINLAMSNRGRKSLRFVGMEEDILKLAVPMKGRYIHSKSKKCESILYDSINNECLYSISRNQLNLQLIKAIENNDNVRLHFQHKLIQVFPDEGTVTIRTAENVHVTNRADIIIASDGAFSGVRMEIQKSCLLDYAQTYINHGYVELTIAKEHGLRMTQNHLHIWPRGTFMMIALPNFDHSWTVTLFMPFNIFEALKTKEDLIDFFKDTFPDFFDYTTPEDLASDFFQKKPMPLVSVKCSPFHFGRVVLLGDAAHAMVPFYGQGMNAGFEDCRILYDVLSLFDVEEALERFTKWRREDAHAICDLAMYNYLEMRNLVSTRSYRIRKFFDNIAFRLMPNTWIPLYNSVSFTDMGYKECCDNRAWQDKASKTQTYINSSSNLCIKPFYRLFATSSYHLL
ncbi:kynurenine 3-monooxygenase-like [Atheta coriaria]|uniref:kynurenine 3-monooxygenase-like n=1 Tax=Dalotia coriaria TaxID=877792 RepID=UPI0031F3792F